MSTKVLTYSMVTPMGETPKHTIWLSNLDVRAGPIRHTPMIYVFKCNGSADYFSFEALKVGLGKTLVPFYPYAGRLGYDSDGRIQIECTGEGVLLIEASCDSTVDELGEFCPSPELHELVLPPESSPYPPCPVVKIQVTYFKCGGVCVGWLMHHSSGDGTASIRFFNAWADITRGVDPTTIPPPILDRPQLHARSPPSIKFDHTNSSTGQENQNLTIVKTRSTILHLSQEQIMHLKDKTNKNIKRSSTFAVVTAHVWRCMCKARGLELHGTTILKFPANIRKFMNPPIPLELMSNAIIVMKVEAGVDDILSGDFCHVTRKIEDVVDSVNEEYVRSFVDFLEEKKSVKREPLGFRANELLVVSWLSFPVYDADFGWGKPMVSGRASQDLPGRVYLKRANSSDGEVVVTATFEVEVVDKFVEFFYTELDQE